MSVPDCRGEVQGLQPGAGEVSGQGGAVALADGRETTFAEEEPRRGDTAEVEIPAYEAMRKDAKLADRMLGILMRGVSTRNCREVLPEIADQVGISKSQVSRENIEVVKCLLEELVERGVKPGRRRLFVIGGAKALRTAIDQVYGGHNPVQRCRLHDQATATLRAAWKLGAKEGMQKIEQYAAWIEREWPGVAGSLREGLAEMFTINRLNLPGSLRRCLATTNLIDSTDSGVRQRTRRVTHWQHGNMALRWTARSQPTE